MPRAELWTLDQAHAWTVWRDQRSVDRVKPGQGPSGLTFRELRGTRRRYKTSKPSATAIAEFQELDRACAAGLLVALRLFANGTTEAVLAQEWRDGTPRNPEQLRFTPAHVKLILPAPDDAMTAEHRDQCGGRPEEAISVHHLATPRNNTSLTQPSGVLSRTSEGPRPISTSECSVWDCAELLAAVEAERFDRVLSGILWGIQQGEIAVIVPADIPSGTVRRQLGLMMHLIVTYELNETELPQGSAEFLLARRMTVNSVEVRIWWRQPAIRHPGTRSARAEPMTEAEPSELDTITAMAEWIFSEHPRQPGMKAQRKKDLESLAAATPMARRRVQAGGFQDGLRSGL
jgi:hypothetical protein